MNEDRDASERLTFDCLDIQIKDYLKLTKEIVKEFNLEPVGDLIHSFDDTFQDYKLNNFLIGLEWDIWSGYIVVAKSVESEKLAKDIAKLLKLNLVNMEIIHTAYYTTENNDF